MIPRRLHSKAVVNNAQSRGHDRTSLVVAVIFLLLAGIAAKLVYLQIGKHDYYVAAASGQHNVEQKLIPERGKIYIQDNYFGSSGDLYPVALNKEFATLFAIPKDISDVQATAEKLFTFFKEPLLKDEVEARLDREAKDRLTTALESVKDLPVDKRVTAENEIKAEHEAYLRDPVYLDFRSQKHDELMEEQRLAEIAEYVSELSNPKSEYELIEKKLDEVTLKKFYLLISGRTDIGEADMSVANGKMMIKASKEEFKLPGFGISMMSFRYYPDNNIGANILGYASYEDQDQHGHYGLEGFFENELYGNFGSVKSERGAGGLVIVNNRQFLEKTDGNNLILTIDRSAQYTSCRLLDEAVSKYGAKGGSVIIVDPHSGAILAMCSAPDFDPNNYARVKDIAYFNNPAVFDEYEPGSVFKAVTMAAALDQGKVTPETTYTDHGQLMIAGWNKPIRNSDFETHGGYGVTNMVTVLEQSLNTGAIFAMQQVGPRVFADYVQKFGFGERTGIELEGESDGKIKSLTGRRITDISAATASFGQGITVTPLQMVMSYAVIANGGQLMKPYIVKEIIRPDGTRRTTPPSTPQRVISERSAELLTGMLINVVENGHSKGAYVPGYYVAGKTGTAQVASKTGGGYSGAHDHTFIGIAPANNPKFVILTKLDSPRARFAESTAVPLAGDITRFLLDHWKVKKDRPLDKK